MSASTKHWFNGQPFPGVDQSGIGASKYWFNGQPLPLISVADASNAADDATDFRVGGAFIVQRFTPIRVSDDYDVRQRTS